VIERELKIPVEGLEAIRRRLVRAGAEPITPNRDEVNILFDTPGGELQSGGQALRVRRVGDRVVVTFKGPASWDGPVKQRREIELEISSGAAIAELLHVLGYVPWMRYEKQRESWRLGGVQVDLDHTPIGDFVELEGPDADLEHTARRLDLDPEQAVTESYPSLWQAHRRRHPELGRDMVFES
jgi:adenylate cyclase class 2